jgi:hypothetical protein
MLPVAGSLRKSIGVGDERAEAREDGNANEPWDGEGAYHCVRWRRRHAVLTVEKVENMQKNRRVLLLDKRAWATDQKPVIGKGKASERRKGKRKGKRTKRTMVNERVRVSKRNFCCLSRSPLPFPFAPCTVSTVVVLCGTSLPWPALPQRGKFDFLFFFFSSLAFSASISSRVFLGRVAGASEQS